MTFCIFTVHKKLTIGTNSKQPLEQGNRIYRSSSRCKYPDRLINDLKMSVTAKCRSNFEVQQNLSHGFTIWTGQHSMIFLLLVRCIELDGIQV